MKALLQACWLQLTNAVTIRQALLYTALLLLACWLQYQSSFTLWQLQYNADSLLRLSCLFAAFLFAAICISIPPGFLKTAPPGFWLLLLILPLLFAAKIVVPGMLVSAPYAGSAVAAAWQLPLIWCTGCVIMTSCILLLHRIIEGRWSLYFIQAPTKLLPFLLLLGCMLPLLLLAATLPAFQQAYPKASTLWQSSNHSAPALFVFEIAYLTDFVSTELFFRGLLPALLSRWLGYHSLLPIAFFYFSIHLGKPFLEAFSSFWGGLLLGSMALHCRSVWGGWLVHAGMALLLELFCYLL